MKKIIISVTLLIIVTFLTATCSLGLSIYFDPMISGSRVIEIDPFSIKGDATQHIVGLEIPVDTFKVGIEYFKGELAGDTELGITGSEFQGYELKGGLNVLNKPDLKVYVTATQFNQDYQDPEVKVDGILGGADITYQFSKKTYANGSIGKSITAEFDGQDASILNYRVKINQMLNNNLTVAVGYRYYSININDWLYDSRLSTSGPIMSLSYNF